MTDLRERMRVYDETPAPDLWEEVVARSASAPPRSAGPRLWALVAVTVLVIAVVSGAALVGSGAIELPVLPAPSIPAVLPDASPSPRPTPDPNDTATWTETGVNVEARAGHTATLLLDGTVLVVGGTSVPSGASLRSTELHDPASGQWTPARDMASARVGHTATLLPDGRVLVVGGISAGSPARSIASAELYDPPTGRWTQTADTAMDRVGHTATLLPNGRVLVAGGAEWIAGLSAEPTTYRRLTSAELYDPATGTWARTGDMNEGRDAHSATLLRNGMVLVAGGCDHDRLASAELYDPTTGSWTTTTDLTEGYCGHSAILLPNGTVLVAGGDAPSGPGAVGWPHAEIYDPSARTWTVAADMITAPLNHTATLLPDGRVLVSGGQEDAGGDSAMFRAAELYDSAIGTWTATLDMNQARAGHTATLLLDGRVLVSGGSEQRSAAELYDPAGGS